eukprot:TRINITY_DN16272_c0_g1_i1.p1 TRINITY_DN16272_c0_g1~~TRINITY_DN16272_c0_g1_i1.p1  ORF type:complete len:116 (+),score=39.39 TRINITY_DN16272_c0_g1_i1:35-382(+)
MSSVSNLINRLNKKSGKNKKITVDYSRKVSSPKENVIPGSPLRMPRSPLSPQDINRNTGGLNTNRRGGSSMRKNRTYKKKNNSESMRVNNFPPPPSLELTLNSLQNGNENLINRC